MTGRQDYEVQFLKSIFVLTCVALFARTGNDLIWPSPKEVAGFYDDWADLGDLEERWGPTRNEWKELRNSWNRGLEDENFPEHLFGFNGDILNEEHSMSYSFFFDWTGSSSVRTISVVGRRGLGRWHVLPCPTFETEPVLLMDGIGIG